MRAPRIYSPLLLSLLSCLWEGFSNSIPDSESLVTLRVQVFDNSDLSPLSGAAALVSGNVSSLASGTAGNDGVVTVTFPYRPGTWVIVMATKQGFVTNSAPWHASRIPLYASVSLYMLPERTATLMVYEDMLQVLLGAPGGRRQAWVQLQWRALPPNLNSSRTELSACLTAPQTQGQLGAFPYPLGLQLNHTGSNSSWVELTALAAVSISLSLRNGSRLQVRQPVHVSVPLPSDSALSSATSAPLWTLHDTTAGLWIRSGSGSIRKEGNQLIWSFVAPQLGYWLAGFPSSTAVTAGGLGDLSSYNTIFLLSILGSMALLVLVLLCLLLYYCRRRCLKPRRPRRKRASSCQRDQCTSTSHLPLISTAHLDPPSHRYRDNPHPAKDSQGLYPPVPGPPPPNAHPSQAGPDPSRPPDYSAPALASTQPGQLVFCHSLEQMRESMYSSLVPTLVIPAHYMNLSSELPGLAGLGAGEQGLGNQGSLTLPRARPSQGEQSQAQRAEGAAPVRIPVLFNDSAMAQVSEELQGLTESQLLELGIKPHPQAWFVSLDGQSNSLVRHSFIELGAGIGARAGPGAGARAGPGARGERKKGDAGRIHSQPPQISSDEASSRQALHEGSVTPDPQGRSGTFPRPGRSRDASLRDSLPSTSPEEGREEEGDRKSPWQKREERPLMVFK
ncbi:protein FAM171A2-like isoform X1 [Osmerus eperlanus]|uniref:protein FAM171A2-like isoform X1 n=1 Tax=Osmerus eperlanus TaxID=29151 RepID=UPI002E11A690